MKRFLLLTFCNTFLLTVNAQWYTLSTNNTNGIFRDVQFTDNTTAYACGEGNGNGTIYKSTNAGLTWNQVYQTSIPSDWIYDLYFTAMDTGFAVGEAGRIYKTEDGGSSWTAQQVSLVNEFTAVFFPSDDTGYVVGNSNSGPAIYKSVDGGLNWIPQVTSASGTLNDVYFTNNMNGYCAGSEVILHTADGGVTWSDVSYSGDNFEHLAVFCTNDSTCYVSGISLLMTTNSGTTWTNVNNQIPLGDSVYVFQALFFTDALNGYAGGFKADTAFTGGYGVIFGTSDGGITWAMETSVLDNPVLANNDVQSIWFTSQDTGYAVGNTGFVLTTDNGGATNYSAVVSVEHSFILYPNPASGFVSITLAVNPLKGTVCNIYSAFGTLVKSEAISDERTIIDLEGLSGGLYMFEIVDPVRTEFQKVLIQND